MDPMWSVIYFTKTKDRPNDKARLFIFKKFQIFKYWPFIYTTPNLV